MDAVAPRRLRCGRPVPGERGRPFRATGGARIVALAAWAAGAASTVVATAPPSAPHAAIAELHALHGALRSATVREAEAYRVSGVTLVRLDAELELTEGTLFPVFAGERVIGVVYEGQGRLRLAPGPAVERDQLEKFTGAPALDEPFKRLLLFFSDETAAELGIAGGRAQALPGFERARAFLDARRKQQLETLGANLASRFLRDSVEGEPGLFFADIETHRHGVVTLIVDPRSGEQVSLYHASGKYGGSIDTWCSYAVAAPIGSVSAAATRYSIDVRLAREKLLAETVIVTLAPVGDGARALGFRLSPALEVLSVSTLDGEPLYFAREQVEADRWESGLTVVLAEPLCEPIEIVFELGGALVRDFGQGQYGMLATRGWYPELGYNSRARFELRFESDERERIFASARRRGEIVSAGRRVSAWERAFPVMAVAFAYGALEIEELELADRVPVTVFGREHGVVIGNALRQVGSDVAESLSFFEDLYGPYPFERMVVTSEERSGGQGFPGLLHLSVSTFGGGQRGFDEAFRAHEVAHQWWGHLVGWQSYHDQWLSEGFAAYSGALFASHRLSDPKLLGEILKAWRNDVLGKGNIKATLGLSPFGRSRELMRHSMGSAAGPVSLGRRLASSRGPLDYDLLVYEKGAWVLHMLRMLLRDQALGSDAVFDAGMREFVAAYRGDNASTADFRAVMEQRAGRDLGWFFDQWIDGTQIPDYRYAWRAERADAGGELLHLRVRQELEPGAEFRMPVPLRIGLADGSSIMRRVEVIGASSEHVLELPGRAVALEFNADDAVLCEARQERF